jgi:hypothetical protein
MALTSTQQAIKLFKKLMGVTDTVNPTSGVGAKEFFNESILSKQAILPSQVWQDGSSLPSTAPVGMTNGQTIGVVKYYQDLSLTAIAGSTTAFNNVNLKNAIPFNYDPAGSYNYTLKDNSNNPIYFGNDDWVVDTDAGVLNFYGASLPANMPPKISFYQYVGRFGVGSGVETIITYNSSSSTLTVSGTTTTTIDLSTLVQQVATGYSDLVANATTSGLTGDGNKANDIALPTNLVIGSPIRIVINGIEVNCGSESTADCFFAIDGGVTQLFSNARASGSEQPGDKLYWRDTALFQLESDDEIDMVFLINK